MPLYRRRPSYKPTIYTSAVDAVATTATETAFATKHTILAGSLVVGKTYRITIRGVYSTIAAAPGSLNLRIKVAGTTVGVTGANSVSVSMPGRGFEINTLVTCVSTGVSGSIEAQSRSFLNTSGTAASVMDLRNSSTFAINTTTAIDLTVTAQWSVADVGNTISLRQMVVEEMG